MNRKSGEREEKKGYTGIEFKLIYIAYNADWKKTQTRGRGNK